MPAHITVDPQTFRQELEGFMRDGDVQAFMQLSQAVKATCIELIHQDQHFEASYMMKNYGTVFISPKASNPTVLLQILPAFPKNATGTLNLLGITDELDEAILASKVDVRTIKPRDGFTSLINWAIGKQQWPLVEAVVLNITANVKEHYTNDSMTQSEVVNGILQTFVYGKECLPPLPGTIDEAVSSIVNAPLDWRLQDEFFDRLARMAMPKTLMKMLEHGRINSINCTQTAEHQHILDCLPENLTAKQLHAVDYFLNLRGIKHRILFDESMHIEHYIAALKGSQFLAYRENDLRFGILERFTPLFTTENIAVAARRKRISSLINAVVDQALSKGGTPEGIRGSLKKLGLPEHAMKLVNLFKGEELESALGL
jgi:hypothetical protein